jgi:hypothetical protein
MHTRETTPRNSGVQRTSLFFSWSPNERGFVSLGPTHPFMNPYPIHAAFKDDRFLIIIEKDPFDLASNKLRIAELISLDDRAGLEFWAAPSLARAMQGAADFYAAAMERASRELDESVASRGAKSCYETCR